MGSYTAAVALTDGSGNGTATTPLINGFLQMIAVRYDSNVTPDVTITEVGGAGRIVLSIDPANTNPATYRPQYAVTDGDGVEIADMYAWDYFEGRSFEVSVTGAQANKANAVTVTILTS